MNAKTVAYRASATLLLAMLVAAGPIRCADQRQEVDFWLTILHSNDGESDLVNLGSGLEDFGGAARFKTVTDGLKSAASHGPWAQQGTRWAVIMVSSGDNLLAGPEFNASLDKGAPFYETTAMDLIGYDAVAIGNHDFDLGPDVLADFIAGHQITRPTYVSANLDYSGEPNLSALFDQGRIARSVVLTKQGENIGLVGVTTPSLSFVSSPRNVAVDSDVAGAIQAEIDRLEAMDVN